MDTPSGWGPNTGDTELSISNLSTSHISVSIWSTQSQHAGQMQCKMFDKRRYRGGWGPVSSDTIVTTDDRRLMVASDRRQSTTSGPCQSCTVSITTCSP